MGEEEQNGSGSLSSPLIEEENKKESSLRGIERREVVEEVRTQIWLAGPLISVTLLNFCLTLISVMFVGHMGELSLSGASMATSFCTVTGFSLLLGMASALDTFCGQSYGAKQFSMLGVHMQRAMFILFTVSIPLAIIWANTKSILIFFGQDHEIAGEAGAYARFMIPCLFAYGLLQCLNRFLQTQNIVYPMMFSSAFTTLLHILVCWLLVFKSGLGNKGAALSLSISYWLNVTILLLYVMFSPSCSKTWAGFSKEALHNLSTFVSLAIPSAVMVCLEMWSFEMIVLLSGLLPNPRLETSVLSICLNTTAIVWMIPFGLSGATSIRVSNELGAGRPRIARLAVYVVFVLAIIEATLCGVVVILIRNVWGYAYSNEVEVVKYVATMMPILSVSVVLDALQSVLSGAARGCGWQKIGAFINLGSYYIVGIPLAVVFAFVLHMGGKGFWMGIILALFVQLCSLMIITIRTDWEKEAKKAADRVHNSISPES